MSPPDVNIKKQEKRHRGPLIGIALGIIAAGILGFLILGEALQGDIEDPVVPASETGETGEADAPTAGEPTAPAE